MTTHALWVDRPLHAEIRAAGLPRPGPDEVLVRSLHSGVSRGTETLVFRGEVPPSQYAAMRAPHQEGDFPGPVKYGYLTVGVVEEGPEELRGRTVFSLHPHQTRFVVPADQVTVVPDGVPPRRAVLAGTIETALNAVWDAPVLVGDRLAVVGAGMVGCSVARLAASIPGTRVTLVDIDESRSDVAADLGVGFVPASAARAVLADLDTVVHTSATSEGLQLALDVLRPEGTVLELSWYGIRDVTVSLGGAFHSRRLAIRASQVGAVAPVRRDSRTTADRLALALELLQDNAFDALLTGHSAFEELPDVLARLSDGTLPALCHVIDHPEGDADVQRDRA
jgi:threonine dehydrogenase-like Zn-dependent dehydrogenase